MDYASDIDSDGIPLRRRRRGGVSFLVIATGTVCLAAAWILAATDPYSELAHRVVEVRAEGAPSAVDAVPLFELALNEDGTIEETAAAVERGPLPAGSAHPDRTLEASTEGPDAPAGAEGTTPATPPPAEARWRPVPHVLFDEPPMIPRSQLIGPQLAAPDVREAALDLDRAERRAVQRRLALAGHDAGVPDGVFGPVTREAIAAYQRNEGLAGTGYVEPATLALLAEQTEEAYRKALAADRRERSRRQRSGLAEAEIAPVPAPRETDGDGCRRSSDGSVIGHQGIGCDIRGLGEGFGRLLRGRRPGGTATAEFEPTPLAGYER